MHSTTNLCPQVAACEDAAHGAFIAWEESDGPLRVAHLLPSGDLDPLWPSFVVASTMDGGRLALRALPDGGGGAYLAWIANDSLFLQRVTLAGEIPPPWPARGRSARKPLGRAIRPTVVPDGEGGLYVGWLQMRVTVVGGSYVQLPTFYLERRDADGLVHAGWPAGGRAIGVDPFEFEVVASSAIASAPGGGVWAAWANTRWWDPTGSGFQQLPGTVRALRLGDAGLPAAGWSAQGVTLASYPGDNWPANTTWQWWQLPAAAQVAVTSDGGQGAFVARALGTDPYGTPVLDPRLHRLDASGLTAGGWPESGLPLGDGLPIAFGDLGPDASISMHAAANGEAYVGYGADYFTESPAQYLVIRCAKDHRASLSYIASLAGREMAIAGDGGFVLADFHPDGQYQYADELAHVACQRSAGPGFSEVQSGPPITWYGDVGVTGLRDGGAILCWSQVHERFGVFAVRLNRAGLVTDAPPAAAASAPRLALRFVAGAGLRASAMFAGTGEARLLLADVAGRAVARETFEAGEGPREWTIPGTASLAPGLYFARVQRGAEVLTARVVVAR